MSSETDVKGHPAESTAVELELSISGDDSAESTVRVHADSGDSLEKFAARITESAQLDGDAVLEVALGVELPERQRFVRDLAFRHKKLRLRRTCIDLHFESEQKKHNFPADAHWSAVHRWGCRHFNVSHDACANLELRAGSSTGAPLNEHQKIGHAKECKTVWMVKPGPEPNG